MIGEHLGPYLSEEYVFTAARGGPVRHRNFMRRHFKPAVESTELPDDLRFHDLRHAGAALLVANGRHLEEVNEYLGHSSIRVTSDRYGPLFPKARAELADSLDQTFAGSATERRRNEGDSVRFLHGHQSPEYRRDLRFVVERTTGFEPATLTLARR